MRDVIAIEEAKEGFLLLVGSLGYFGLFLFLLILKHSIVEVMNIKTT